MAGLVLDTDEVIVRKTVGARMVLGFHRSATVPHHHVEGRNGAAKRGQRGYQNQRQNTPIRGHPVHQHPILTVGSDLLSQVSYVNTEGSHPGQGKSPGHYPQALGGLWD